MPKLSYVRPRGALKATNRFKLFTYSGTHENTLEFLLARKHSGIDCTHLFMIFLLISAVFPFLYPL